LGITGTEKEKKKKKTKQTNTKTLRNSDSVKINEKYILKFNWKVLFFNY